VFALILPETARGNAATKLESVRRAVNALTIGIEGLPPATLSVGFASYPERRHRSRIAGALGATRADRGQACRWRSAGQLHAGADASGAEGAALAAAKASALGRSLSQAAFRSCTQPIVDVRHGHLIGYEALCRPTTPAFAHVGELLETAVRCGRIGELGRVLRRIVVEPCRHWPSRTVVREHPPAEDLN